MMRLLISIVFIGLVALGVMRFTGDGVADDTPIDVVRPVVLELFTSQSCSSCPPADALLKQLAENPKVIALGCHVTYWDHTGWKDTLSLQTCTDRQKNYDQYLSKGTYTPQLVVNGREALIGSRKKAVTEAIAQAADIKPIRISMSGLQVDVRLPSDFGRGDYFVTVFGVLKTRVENITKGENKGEVIPYTNAVTEIVSLGPWDGMIKNGVATFETESDGAVVLVQDAKTWQVVGAGQAFIR